MPVHQEIFRLGGLKLLIHKMEDPAQAGATRNAALAALTNICPSVQPPHSQALIEALVRLMSIENTPLRMKQEATASLRNLSGTSTENGDIIVTEKGAVQLIDAIVRGTVAAQEHGAATLRNVARTNLGRMGLVQDGAVGPLVECLSSERDKQREVSASALANIALLPKNQVLLVQAGCVPPLVAMLRADHTAEEAEEAASALANLAVSIKNQKVLVNFKAIPGLVRMIHVGTARGKQQAAAALRNLTASNVGEVAGDFVRVGAVPPLLAATQEGTKECIEHAIATILNLAADKVGRMRIMEEKNAAGVIVSMLSSEDAGTRERAAGTVTNLAAMPEYQLALADAGAIEPLVQLLQKGGHRGREEAAVALSNLAICRQNQLKVATALGVADNWETIVDETMHRAAGGS